MKNYWIKKQFVIVRAESSDTHGVCALLEMQHPLDFGPPMHVHEREDEGFYILQGRYKFILGKQTKFVGPGEFVLAPKGMPHSFASVGPGLGKMLVYFTPGGVEAYFEELSKINFDAADGESKSAELDKKYGITVLKQGNNEIADQVAS